VMTLNIQIDLCEGISTLGIASTPTEYGVFGWGFDAINDGHLKQYGVNA